jgi:hypothetical protein
MVGVVLKGRWEMEFQTWRERERENRVRAVVSHRSFVAYSLEIPLWRFFQAARCFVALSYLDWVIRNHLIFFVHDIATYFICSIPVIYPMWGIIESQSEERKVTKECRRREAHAG